MRKADHQRHLSFQSRYHGQMTRRPYFLSSRPTPAAARAHNQKPWDRGLARDHLGLQAVLALAARHDTLPSDQPQVLSPGRGAPFRGLRIRFQNAKSRAPRV